MITVFTLVITALVVPRPPAASAAPGNLVLAADLSLFRPGNIISNEVFFDSATMTASQIDAFLRSKVNNCASGYVCLKDYRQSTPDRAADGYCGAYSGAVNETAAAILSKVATACGINPQVLIVMLQKERGLVTSTAPSRDDFLKAMGQACPDNADCDSQYAGFFSQVYGAARQMQIYTLSKYFTYYAPGKTWNIRYDTEIACGSSPVYIENQATANLYYYTPYQPNAASLRAGYGVGDGCSSYGNRNFYSYFTDWFGSTQVARLTLVKLATDTTVWLINGGRRWHVGNQEDLAELSRVFGSVATVPSSYITAAQYSGDAGAILRDSATGDISLIQDGQRHRLTSCEAVADLGGSCSAPVDVASALVQRVPAGPAVGAFFRIRGGDRWGRFEEGRDVTPLYNASAARALAGDVRVTPYAPFMNSDIFAAVPKRPLLFAPAQLVRAANDPKVFLTVDFDKIAYVPSWDSVSDYNRVPGDLAVVPASDLTAYTAAGTVSPLLSCDGATYLPAMGWLNRLADPGRTGITPIPATAATCAQFSTRDGTIAGDVAVKTADSADVFVLEGATRRPALTWSALVAHNGGSAPVITTVSAGVRQALPAGAPVVSGLVVKATSSPELYLGGDQQISWIPTAGLAADAGIVLDYRVLPDAQVASLKKSPTLGSWIRCGTTTSFAAEGRLWPTSSAAAQGFTPVVLEAGACSALNRSSSAPLDLVAVKADGAADVFVARDGKLRHVTSWAALVGLNGGSAPRILTVSRDALAALPAGDPISG
ncbi:hypothetical protein [Microbacterium sp. B19]|uniref:hypothetical protein n=1 Tax=Microbacterium sp. B19 TaxID=96765 RepID=UPI0011D25D9F|nr:hypothetical protein [Microbacterium sp. B19]